MCDMRTAGMMVKDTADYYKMPRSTICNIVKRYKDYKYKKISKKTGSKIQVVSTFITYVS